MLVDLRELKPNPMRDFAVDPMDEDRIEELRKSIEEDGFWGGVCCRQVESGEIQIAAGHTRVAAAIRAGYTKADLFVGNGDMDDAVMVRIYARENATQRGNLGTAQVGSVASAVRFVAKAALTGHISTIVEMSQKSADSIVGNIASDKGIGSPIIVDFLAGVPGINEGTVKQALANLKASGDYARIIREVQEEIERENAEALAALEAAEREQERIRKEREEAEERQRQAEAARKEAAAKAKAAKEEADRKRAQEDAKRAELERQKAEEMRKLAAKRQEEAAAEMKKFEAMKKTRDTAKKAAEAAEKKDVTFDFAGVAIHFKNPHQIDVFRQCVTGQGIAPFLPVNRQADLAKRLVEMAKSRNAELSGAFIRENITTLALQAKGDARQASKEEQERVMREDMIQRMKQLQRDFSRSCGGIASYGIKISELMKKWPKGLQVPTSNEFLSSIEAAKKVIDALSERI